MADFNSNIWKMYLFRFFRSLHFIGAVFVPFFTEWAGLSFTQIMILQSWFMLWVFLFEVPTGAIADQFGRKSSLALGTIITALGALLYVSMPNFYIFLIAEFVWAMGGALFSGANEAFVYDTLKKIKKSAQSKKIFARLDSAGLAGIMVGAPIGSVIASQYGLTAPMLLMIVPFTVAFLISLTLKEPKTRKRVESKRYLSTLTEGVKFFYSSKVLKILTLDLVFIASIGYYMIWMYQPMLQNVNVNIAYFGIVHAVFVLSQIILMNNFDKLEKILGTKRRLLFLTSIGVGILYIIGGLFIDYLPMVLLTIIVGGGLALSRRPLFVSYMNKHIPSSKRATVLSSVSMVRNFALVIVNPFVGALVDYSLQYTLIILGIIAIIFSFISRIEEKHLID